jgi:hypothetical protein
MSELIKESDFAEAFTGFDIGNSTSALYILRDKIAKETKTFDGQLITLDLIKQLYSKYNKYWIHKYGKNDPKYVSKTEKRKTVYDFLMEGMYNNTYKIEEAPRDSYLFGNMDRQEMIQKTKKFIGYE